MSKFDPYEVSVGGSDRIYYKNAVLPMGAYSTAYNFTYITWKYGRLPIVFSDCDFENCVFDSVDLSYAVFLNCTFQNCTFRRCVLNMATFIDCNGHRLIFRLCNAQDMLFMHGMVDGITATRTDMTNSRISVNTEYLAPIVLNACKLEGASIQNVRSMQYESPFGLPALSGRDRVSVKTDRCSGQYSLVGFQYVKQ